MHIQRPIRILVVDDHPVVRSGLAAILKTYRDLEVVGEAADGEEAIRWCGTARPDVIVMDLHMPCMGGITATRYFRQHYPAVNILILSGFQDDNLVQEAFQAGADGYLLKHSLSDELVKAIRDLAQGQTALAPEAVYSLISAVRNRNTPVPGNDLSVREREVLSLMAKGFNNQRIAESLVISQATAKFHVSSIMSKLHATSRTHAVAIAFEHNLASGHTHAGVTK